MKVFYTYGAAEGFPFVGGWVEVEAEPVEKCHEIYQSHYPARIPGILNCAFYYTEEEFNRTEMSHRGNYGAYCHRSLTTKKE